jgi:hypothetical protein
MKATISPLSIRPIQSIPLEAGAVATGNDIDSPFDVELGILSRT